MKSLRITEVIKIHRLGTMIISTKLHGNPSNGCWDISAWTEVVDQHTNTAKSHDANMAKDIDYIDLSLQKSI